MKLTVALRRLLIPGIFHTIYHLVRNRVMVSPRAEVEWSRLLKIGRRSQISSFVKIKASNGPVVIGARTDIGCGAFIAGHQHGVEIGDDCLISPNVSIIGVNYRYDRADAIIREQGVKSEGPVQIGNNVWIGAGAVILDNCRIGDGAIISPNSVVSGPIPPLAIASGNPAKVIFVRR
ncbi:acyltransferase [Sphingobium bisphenolivorans]|uniref:acyltransferase n=1 Tax=Sphingobium bisphenolivorans TaxID=1335760 RepID=UPI00039A94D4|nr:acyltransferase [Sphingobium bisphenolivorans]